MPARIPPPSPSPKPPTEKAALAQNEFWISQPAGQWSSQSSHTPAPEEGPHARQESPNVCELYRHPTTPWGAGTPGSGRGRPPQRPARSPPWAGGWTGSARSRRPPGPGGPPAAASPLGRPWGRSGRGQPRCGGGGTTAGEAVEGRPA